MRVFRDEDARDVCEHSKMQVSVLIPFCLLTCVRMCVPVCMCVCAGVCLFASQFDFVLSRIEKIPNKVYFTV